ncbi:hypothetical protein ACWFRB_08695 [Rhodococcus sp. NPDC055112]
MANDLQQDSGADRVAADRHGRPRLTQPGFKPGDIRHVGEERVEVGPLGHQCLY